MIIYIPYTYLIGWSKQQIYYYGVRFANNDNDVANPEDFWVSYFTSSKHVKFFREKYGEPDIVQIRKTFNNREQARLWEHTVLRRMNVVQREDFLNKSDSISIPSQKGIRKPPGHQKGERNSMYGKKRPDTSEYNRTRTNPLFGKSRPEHSQKMKGKNNPMFGISKGLLFWNNGVSTIRSKECPGLGWSRGRVKRQSHIQMP